MKSEVRIIVESEERIIVEIVMKSEEERVVEKCLRIKIILFVYITMHVYL